MYRAARLLNCPPWVLERRDDYWLEKALLFDSAESEARAILQRQAQATARAKGKH